MANLLYVIVYPDTLGPFTGAEIVAGMATTGVVWATSRTEEDGGTELFDTTSVLTGGESYQASSVWFDGTNYSNVSESAVWVQESATNFAGTGAAGTATGTGQVGSEAVQSNISGAGAAGTATGSGQAGTSTIETNAADVSGTGTAGTATGTGQAGSANIEDGATNVSGAGAAGTASGTGQAGSNVVDIRPTGQAGTASGTGQAGAANIEDGSTDVTGTGAAGTAAGTGQSGTATVEDNTVSVDGTGAAGTATGTGQAGSSSAETDTVLTGDDLNAVAQIVFDKLVAEGVVAKIVDVWQRLGLDPTNPVTNNPDGSYSVGDISVDATQDGGSITQTRQ